MSWSYQSNNPCSVLVKEKQDALGRDCLPPILHSSSTETAASSQPETPSSLGNSVGGKMRLKREAHEDVGVDVVFDGDGAQSTPHEIVEKRILVNISIVMDGGLGSLNQEIYQLHVAVPFPNEAEKKPEKFYAYDVSGSDNLEMVNESFNATAFDDFQTSSADASTFSINSQSTDESSTTTVDEFNETSSLEGLKTNLNEKGKLMDHDDAKMKETHGAFPPTNSQLIPSSFLLSHSCFACVRFV
jgi:hypothetical protein